MTVKVWPETPAGAGGLEASVKDANYTITGSEDVGVDSTGGTFTVTLKASPVPGDVAFIHDVAYNCGTTAVAIARNGSTIAGLSEDAEINLDGGGFWFVCDTAGNWLFTPLTSGGLDEASVDAKIIGLKSKTFWVNPDMRTTTTLQPSAEHTIGHSTTNCGLIARGFDAAQNEVLCFNWDTPNNYDETYGVFFSVIWSPETTNTGTCVWELKCLSLTEGGAIDAAPVGSLTLNDAALGTVDDIQYSGNSAVGLESFLTKNETVVFRIGRLGTAGADTLTGDANLIGLRLHWKTDAAIED